MTPKKIILITCAFLSLALGIAGIFLPLLPTTPFLLLSAWCFIRSSRRLYQWLVHHPVFGMYIRNYLLYRAIPRKTKIFAVILLWSSITISIIIVGKPVITCILIFIGLAVSWHIITLRKFSGKKVQAEPTDFKNNL
jgi:uncharacterized membrane protein YbaN (DUF454 family)